MLKLRVVKGQLFYVILSAVLLPLSGNSQQKLNNKFEYLSIEGIERPWGWEPERFSSVSIQLDDKVREEGNYSLRLISDDKNEEQALLQAVHPYELRGKLLRLEGVIKSMELSDSAFFELGFGVGMDFEDARLYGVSSEKISGSSDWTHYSVEQTIPDSAEFVYLKVAIKGSGTCWFDNFSLFNENQMLSEVVLGSAFTKRQLRWVKRSCAALDTFEPEATTDLSMVDFSKLAAFGKAVQNTRIIALGEATHGTSEFFKMKHRVLQYSVEELGVRIFAIEDNQLIVERVNRYVQGGSGTARSCMYGIFSISQNEEVHNMIQWIRNYNDANPNDKIQFVGFDMQNVYPALDSLRSFTNYFHPHLLGEIDSLLSDFEKNIPSIYTATDEQKMHWSKNARKVYSMIFSQEPRMKELHPHKSFEISYGTQFIRLIVQYIDNSILGHESLYRDVAMAANVTWILDNYAPNSKMLIWAHDYHISLGEHEDLLANIYAGKSMGSQLRNKYGANYKAYSLATYEGAYWGQVNYMNFKQLECPLYPSPKSSLDYALHVACRKRNSSVLFYDMSKARSKKWLTQMRPTRFANHVNIEFGYFTSYSVPFQFDGVLFIHTTSAARAYD